MTRRDRPPTGRWSLLLLVAAVTATLLVPAGQAVWGAPQSPEHYVFSLFKGADTSAANRDRIIETLPGIDWRQYDKASGGRAMDLLQWLYGLRTQDPRHVPYLLEATTGLDGAWAETYAGIVGQLFDDHQAVFLRVLGDLPSERAGEVARLLVYHESYGDLAAFRKELEGLAASGGFQGGELAAIGAILAALDRHQAQTADPAPGPGPASRPPPPVIPALPFDPDTILGFIAAQRVLGGLAQAVDEEFFGVLAMAYCLDPEFFVKTIAPLPAGEIKAICRFVAKGLTKSGKRPAAAVGAWLNAREARIFRDIQREIEAALCRTGARRLVPTRPEWPR